MRRAGLVLTVALWFAVAVSTTNARSQEASTVEPRHPLIIVTFPNAPNQPAQSAGTTGRRYAGNGYLVAQSAHRQAHRVAVAYALREVANWPIRSLAVHCVVYEVPDDRPIGPILSALSKDPEVSLAQPLQQFHTLTQSEPAPYNDPLYDLQTNLTTLGIATAHERSQGSGVRVALIDTGVDTNHPDLHDRIAGSHSFVPRNAASAGSYRHGTAMAGLIAAAANNRIGIVGIAPLARIEVFAACWQLQPDSDEAACNTFTLAQALSAVLDAGIPLVNLSIAGPADPLLSALIAVGVKHGVIFVGAGVSDSSAFPTGITGVIGVGSAERELGRPILTAPAVHVLTLRPLGQYDFESGSSVAAAEVTGVIALLLAADRHLTPGAVETLLKETAGSVDAPPASMVNVNAALARIAAQSGNRVATAAQH